MAEVADKTDSFPQFDSITRRGTGSQTISGLTVDHAAVLHFECPQCSGYISMDTDSREDGYPFWGDGPQDARILVGATGGTITRMTIAADADWTLTVEDLNSLPTSDGVMQGSGFQAFVYTGSGPRMTMDYQGESNFMVDAYFDDSRQLLANEIGTTTLTEDIKPGVIAVQSEGTWSFTPEQ